MKRRFKKFVWASLLVIAGALFVHNPFAVTAEAAQTSGAGLSEGQQQKAFLETAMAATGASPDGYAIHDWTVLNHQFIDKQALQSIGQQLKQDFNITKAKVTTRSEQNQMFWQVDGQWSNSTNVRLVLTSLLGTSTSGKTSAANETVLTITALGSDSSLANFAQQYDHIENMVASVQGTPQMSAYLTGALKAQVSESQANILASKALKAVNATSVEALRTKWETSVSGYANDALTYIDTNGKRMNIQVAVHDDTYHHRTDVLVGTPIITTTY